MRVPQEACSRSEALRAEIKMIDDMVVLLGEEQKNDDKEKDFCPARACVCVETFGRCKQDWRCGALGAYGACKVSFPSW